MNVLLINGSPRPHGNTSIALGEMVKTFQAEGVETGVVQVGNLPVRRLHHIIIKIHNGTLIFQNTVYPLHLIDEKTS